MKRIECVTAVVISAALVLVSPSTAAADDTMCVGSLTGTFDNVIVPPGQTCVLNDAMVWGNVKALEDSRLRINNSRVNGNVEGDKADIVQLFFTVVREQITIKEGGPAASILPSPFNVCGNGILFSPCEALMVAVTVEVGGIQVEKTTGSVFISSSDVNGNVKVEANAVDVPEVLTIRSNTVNGNVQVFKNAGSGEKTVRSNTVGQSLQCSENDPPFLAGFNTAAQAEGQCAAP
jgi:hypothetical protein